VDRLYYFSQNQGPVLAEHLGLGADRLRCIPFGVDDETFTPSGEADSDYVLVVGRDSGRDWPTLFSALEGVDLPVKLCCRPADIAGLRVPAEVDVLGYVDRTVYRELLGRARVVALATKPLLYPSGQSVLLEAMAMARTVVVTESPALADYVVDGTTALCVPQGDAAALRRRIVEAAGDDDLRGEVGRQARNEVDSGTRCVLGSHDPMPALQARAEGRQAAHQIRRARSDGTLRQHGRIGRHDAAVALRIGPDMAADGGHRSRQ
jgi:glycosyltransferase involved in cell wall biosynthesis